jgi:uncharacterized membrane protein
MSGHNLSHKTPSAKASPRIKIFDVIETPSEKRLETLSDGVFAVAMTLLILDIKLPPISNDVSAAEYGSEIWALWPKVGVFVLSFVVLARAWELHRYVFSFLIRYDHTLIYLNMAYLMAIVFLPFSTSLVGEHSRFEISAVIYATNFLPIAGFKFLMWSYATRNHRLVKSELRSSVVTWLKRRLVLSITVIIVAILTALVYPQASILLLLLYQLTMLIVPFFRRSLQTD